MAPGEVAPNELALDMIDWVDRVRPIDMTRVESLRVSMRENGFFGAILVRPRMVDDKPRFRGVLVAHRATAWGLEGAETIPGQVRVLTDDEALQIEIDENLVRPDLTPLERAEMVAQRFDVWRRRFPDRVVEAGPGSGLKRGRPGKSVNLTEFLRGAPQHMGFAAQTAAQVGLSTSTVERAWRVVTGLPPELRRQLHGTPLAKNEGMLRQLAALPDHEEQAKVAAILVEGRTKNLSEALALAAGRPPVRPAQTPVDETVKAFRKLWSGASPSAKAAILNDLAGRPLPKGWLVREERA